MPTAGRLAAAVLFAALGWYVSQLIMAQMDEGTQPVWYAEINALIGVAMGWTVAGSRARGPWMAAVSYGLTATIAMVFWIIFLHSFVQMIKNSMRGSYGSNPSNALVDVFRLMMDTGALMSTSVIITTLLGGGILAGLVTEYVARRNN
ncbi:MAG: TrgA family protein [Rhodobacterales bacterium]|nr:TrgA family protein [Rhodobacterales bacterium]